MTNKANFKNHKIVVTPLFLMPSAKCLMPGLTKNKPKQSQFFGQFLSIICENLWNLWFQNQSAKQVLHVSGIFSIMSFFNGSNLNELR